MSSESTHFKHDDFSSDTQDLSYKSDAHVPPGQTFLHLTKTNDSGKPQKSSVGLVLYTNPVLFKASTEDGDTPADGIAFFITGSLNFPNDGSHGNFGIFNPPLGSAPGLVAVEFDIFHNQWDPDLIPPHHIGIDLESRVSSRWKEHTSLSTGKKVTAEISYEETNHQINVKVTSHSDPDPDPDPYTLSFTKDLSDILPNEVYVGISSSTGDRVAVHDIHSWSFHSDIN